MSWMRMLYILVGINVVLHQAESSGVFELRLLSYNNTEERDDVGKCCSGRTGPDSECVGSCHPVFRICLKEYQVKIVTTSKCTFGDVITKNVGSPAIEPIAFPFPFTWPGTFSLIVEVWHGNQPTNHTGVLISRLTKQSLLDVNDEWTEDVHASKYSTLKFKYRVTCDPHYYGKGCENLCRPRDDQFGHYSCSPTGQIVCLAGWQGDYCTKPRCLLGCDEQHGHCTKPNECECQSGWEGTYCNQCRRYPGCMHGTCVKPWDCLCDEGWGGLFCNQDLNFCTNHKPCRNGGTCFNTGQGSYTCTCPAGFTGTECEIAINDCTRKPCENGGTCNRNGSYHLCQCPAGFSGSHCELATRTCRDRPCYNGGTCSAADGGGYKCDCPRGYAGSDCEISVSRCSPNPCENEGVCSETGDGGGGYRCSCPLGFAGDDCEINIDDCQAQPCLNGATCIDKINEFRCQCVPGFLGDLCESRVDICLTKPCANGGTCIQLTNDYKCNCAPGFTGRGCSVELDECQSRPCQNGGTCVRRVHGFECRCVVGFAGATCEEAASSAAPSARVSSETNLTTEHVVVIATISTFVPLVVLVAFGVIVCLKQRRKKEKARADEEARLQNEQNSANSSFAKRTAAEAHMIKNSWGKCTNNAVASSNLPSPDECSVSNISVADVDGFQKSMQHHQQIIDGRPVYSLQRTRSQKQLNVEPGARASSAHLTAKMHEPEYEHIKRLSVMSNTSAVCGSSDPSLLKRSIEKEAAVGGGGGGGVGVVGGGVYVIEEHFHHLPDALSAGHFATEV